MYKEGVITSTKCGEKLDHGVLAVGYGTTDDGTAYYLVKNSWGPDWGVNGYVKIGVAAGNGICGI
jgi:C1A family cysteine protease